MIESNLIMDLRSGFYLNSAANRAEKEAAYREKQRKQYPKSISIFVMDVESFKNGPTVGAFQITIKKCWWQGSRLRVSVAQKSTIVFDVLDVKSDTEQMNKNHLWCKRIVDGRILHKIIISNS